MKSQQVPVPWAPMGWDSQMSPPPPLEGDRRQVGVRNTEALWERTLIFFSLLPFLVAYDSLKDFHDIYEVAALKWKVGALRGGTRPTVPWEGDEAGPALGWAPCIVERTGGPRPNLPIPLQYAIPVKSPESQTPLVAVWRPAGYGTFPRLVSPGKWGHESPTLLR